MLSIIKREGGGSLAGQTRAVQAFNSVTTEVDV